jgi:phosphoglycerate dehydrogenase-like enzyme
MRATSAPEQLTDVVLYGDAPAREADRLRRLLGAGFRVVPLPATVPRAACAEALAEVRIMVAYAYGRADPPAPRLQLLQCMAAGTDRIELEALPPGCAVLSATGHEIAMAEFAIAAILDWQIGFRALTMRTPDGTWSQQDWIKGPTHDEVFGRTVGLVGYGRVAHEIAQRAHGFGMRVAAISRWSGSTEHAMPGLCRFPMDAYRDFLAECDFVVVTLPLEAATRSIIDHAWFAAMRPRTVLINIGRGAVVDEAELFASLRDRRIRGATLDVWWRYPAGEQMREPMADHPFHTLPNVVASPHAAARTPQMLERRWQGIAANIRAAASTG